MVVYFRGEIDLCGSRITEGLVNNIATVDSYKCYHLEGSSDYEGKGHHESKEEPAEMETDSESIILEFY